MISKFIIKVGNASRWKKIVRKSLLKKNHAKITQLPSTLPQEYKYLGTSLVSAFNGVSVTNCNKHNEIIQLQKDLFKSDDTLSVKDYGSGSWLTDRFTQSNNREFRKVKKRVNMMSWLSAKPPVWSLYLMNIICEKNPKLVLELGTNLGLSALNIASALNDDAKLITLEGSSVIADKAKSHFKQFNLDNIEVVVGSFKETLGTVLADNNQFDVVFIDGHHDGNATERYYAKIKPYLSTGAVVIFDDINWSKDMNRAWNNIHKSDDISLSLDLFSIGVAVYHPGKSTKIYRDIKLI